MACSIKLSSLSITHSNLISKRDYNQNLGFLSFSSTPKSKNQKWGFSYSIKKPLYISRIENPKAYEADKSQSLDLNIELPKSQVDGQRVKIGIYFAIWWGLNVVFNIYNKKVLNAYPFPWLTSTLSLATGSLIMLISWAMKIAEF